jgi:hypothetical protein
MKENVLLWLGFNGSCCKNTCGQQQQQQHTHDGGGSSSA